MDKGSYSHKDPQTRGLALYLCPMSIVYLAITLVFIRHQARNIEVLGASSRCTGCYLVNLTGQGGFLPNFHKKIVNKTENITRLSGPESDPDFQNQS